VHANALNNIFGPSSQVKQTRAGETTSKTCRFGLPCTTFQSKPPAITHWPLAMSMNVKWPLVAIWPFGHLLWPRHIIHTSDGR